MRSIETLVTSFQLHFKFSISTKLTGFTEDAVLREMIVQIAAVHQVENEAQLIGRMEGVAHAYDERTIFAGGHEIQHKTFVYC